MSIASTTLTAHVAPSPFDGGGSSDVAVEVRDGDVILTEGARSVTLRPSKAVMGHGTLHLTTTGPARRLTLTFERYDAPKVARQHAANLGPLYQRLSAAGFRDLLVALRDSGVRLTSSPALRQGAGIHRTSAWVGASALLFVELALFGLPAGAISVLAVGGAGTMSATATAALITGLAVFLLLAIATSPIPLVVRRSFEQGASRDPVAYLDTWAAGAELAGNWSLPRRSPVDGERTSGGRPTFVPGVPALHAVILAAACAFYASRAYATMLGEVAAPPATESGTLAVPDPAWLGGTAISLAGYAGMALLLVVFGISIVRWRLEPALYSIRWAPLVGAFLCFAFGQAGADLRLNTAEEWLYLVMVVMIVAFTCGRLAVGFMVFAAMALFLLLAAFGFFDSPGAIMLLLPVMVLIGAIVARYFPGGARLVPLPLDRAATVRRAVWILWAVTIVLGIGNVVAVGQLM